MSDTYKYTVSYQNKFLNDKGQFELRKPRVKVEDEETGKVSYVGTLEFDTYDLAEAKAKALNLPEDSYTIVRFKLDPEREAKKIKESEEPKRTEANK